MIYLYEILIFPIAVSLFSFNQFSLFDLLGVRSEVQILVVPLTLIISFVMILPRTRRLLRDPLFVYLAVMLIIYSIKNIEITESYNLMFSMLVAGVIITAPKRFHEKLAKLIIGIVFLFSLMGILQAIILMFNPALTKDLAVFSGAYLNSKENLFFADSSYGIPEYPEFRFLGLGDGGGGQFGPFYFSRLRSFLHEPSLVVAYFALPGALSLTFGGHWKKIGIIILIFTCLTGASSAFVLVPIALFSYIILRIKNVKYALFFPFVGGLIFYTATYYFVPAFNPLEISSYTEYWSDTGSFIGSGDDKMVSYITRLGLISNAVGAYFQNPIFGVGVDLHSPLGLFAWSAVYGGALGCLVVFLLFSNLFKMLIQVFKHAYTESLFKAIPYVLIYAIFIEAAWFNDYGFSVGFGLTMIALTYRRLQEITSQYSMNTVNHNGQER